MLHPARRARSWALTVAAALLLAMPLPLGAADIPIPTSDDYTITSADATPLPLSANATTLSLADDQVTEAFSLGFTTTFFGQPTSLFWVGSNGFVTLFFQTPPGCCQGGTIPASDGVDGIIAGFWTDLDPAAGGTIRFDHQSIANASALVVDYSNVSVKGGGSASFQVVVQQSGEFEIRLGNVSTPLGLNATIGAESENGTRGVQLLHADGVSEANEGFHFTPIRQPTPPPVIDFVSPNPVSIGSGADLFGANFLPGASVLVAGQQVPSFVESDGFIFFFVPDGTPLGFDDLTVTNPDGNSTTRAGFLEVVDAFRVDFVSPTVLRQNDTLTVFGSGFGPGSVALLDGAPVPTERFSNNTLLALAPRALPPGSHVVSVFNPARGTANGPSVFVQGRPDLVLVALDAQRDRVGTTVAPVGVDVPGPWRVHVRVENRGDEVADDVTLAANLAPAQGTASALNNPSQHASTFAARLLPGGALEGDFLLGSATDVGDFVLTGVATEQGVAERDMSNNVQTQVVSGYVSGVPGLDPNPCVTLLTPLQQCQGPEQRRHDVERRDQTDRHVNGPMRVDVTMRFADFDFNNPTLIFDSQGVAADGSQSFCTTWRFTGQPQGTMLVRMAQGNGLSGLAQVFGAATSNGTIVHERWNDTRAFGVILSETTHVRSTPAPSDPLSQYAFSASPSAAWTLTAQGLTGDFTRCTVTSGHSTTERFVYAALPDDVNGHEPGFAGFGFAASAQVVYNGTLDNQSSQPITGALP